MRASVVITVLFLVGGALGGWWFLADNAVSDAHAQVQGQCSPGRNCSVNSITATTPSSNVALSVLRGSYLQLHHASEAGSGSNYLRANGATTVVHGSGGISLSGVLTTTTTSSVASGSNAFALSTNGARVDFGTASNDYCASNGTYVVCNGSTAGVVLRRGQADGVDVASIAAGTCNDAATTVTMAGAALTDGSVCMVGNTPGGTGIAADVVPYAWPSDATTVTIRLCCNNGGSACDPASQNYHVTCLE